MDKLLIKLTENIRNKKYSKILYILTNMKNNTEFLDIKTNKAVIEQKEILKMIILNDVQISISNKIDLVPDIIAIVKYLDIDFQEKMEKIVVNHLIQIKKEFFEEKIIVINSIIDFFNVLNWYEGYKKELENKYLYMPEFWCVVDVITLVFCEMLERKFLNLITALKDSPERSVEVINRIVKFEIKNTRNILCRKGCLNKENKNLTKPIEKENILFVDDSKNDLTKLDNTIVKETPFTKQDNNLVLEEIKCNCKNKKVLSKCITNFLGFYVNEQCKNISGLFFNKNETEMHIITCFVQFFNELSKLYYKVMYFENVDIFLQFGLKCDKQLCYYISLIELSNKFKEGIIIANTLLFIEQTMNEFLNKIKQLIETSENTFNSFKKIRELEKKQFIILDRTILMQVQKLKLNPLTNFSENLSNYLNQEIFCSYFDQLSPELANFILTSIFTTLLLIISKYKLNVERAEHILTEMTELKANIIRKKRIPYLDVIECYLKIFLVPSEDVENFVSNFFAVSKMKFDFSQILKKLVEKENNAKLYIEFKKSLKN